MFPFYLHIDFWKCRENGIKTTERYFGRKYAILACFGKYLTDR